MKMADGPDIDLYADDIEQDFAQDEFTGEGVDLYDDVIAAAPTGGPDDAVEPGAHPHPGAPAAAGDEANGAPPYHQLGNNIQPNTIGRRYQLYIGNLSWWTTDQDITDAVAEIGVNDFLEVKFFENRANGQSKGFCVISLGSEQSMRMCMEHLPKKELHGQIPVVTLPTKQALNQFESQSKTRLSTPNPGPRGPHPGAVPTHQNPNMPPGPHPQNPNTQRMMMGPPQGIRGPVPPPGMPPPGPPGGPPPRMQGPPLQGPPPGQLMPPNQGPPRFQQQPQWNPNGPRPNGPPRPPGPPQGPPQGGPPQHRPGMPFQGAPQGPNGPGPRGPVNHGPPGPRPEWNRPPLHQGFPPHNQAPPHMQGPPRGPPMGGPPSGPHGPPQVPPQAPHVAPAPHVNPAFFQQGGGPPHQQGMQHPGGPPPQHGPPLGPPHGPPIPPHGPANGPPHGPPHGYGPPAGQAPYGAPTGPEHRSDTAAVSEQEFEDIMGRNRTVSSSAIARAVSDAAAGDYAGAIETLVTAISLIKQSKVANDDRCKILISSLQDTLHGVEAKSYGSSRRDRSRSRDRSHRRRDRRERSASRYRERSRDRDRDRERERERDRYYGDGYNRDAREPRERSRSRGERERERDYRDRSPEDRVVRPRNKSPPEATEVPTETTSSKSRYYEERYRDRGDRERERERERDGGTRGRESERERDRERDTHRSRH